MWVNVDSGARLSRFEAWVHPFLALWCEAKYLNSLFPNMPTRREELIKIVSIVRLCGDTPPHTLIPTGIMYEFPIAFVTNSLEFRGLNQQKSIIFQLWRPEVQKDSHSPTIKVSPEWVPSRGSRGESFLPLPTSGGRQHSLACGCTIPSSASGITSLSLLL